MDTFKPVKNLGKSSKKSANAEDVINSNDKGLRMMNFVHELQVYNNMEKNQLIAFWTTGNDRRCDLYRLAATGSFSIPYM